VSVVARIAGNVTVAQIEAAERWWDKKGMGADRRCGLSTDGVYWHNERGSTFFLKWSEVYKDLEGEVLCG